MEMIEIFTRMSFSERTSRKRNAIAKKVIRCVPSCRIIEGQVFLHMIYQRYQYENQSRSEEGS